MKRITVFTYLAMAIILASTSCNGSKTAAGGDTDSVAVADSSVIVDTSADDEKIIEQLNALFLPDNSPVYSEEWLKKHCSEECLSTLHRVYNRTIAGNGYWGPYLIGEEDGIGFSKDFQGIQKVEHNGKQLFRARINMLEQSSDDRGLYTLAFVDEIRDVFYDCSLKDGELLINKVEWEQTPNKYDKLPKTAEFVGEGKGYKAYVNTLKESEEGSIMELWLTDVDKKYAKKLFTSSGTIPKVDWKASKEYLVTTIPSISGVDFFQYCKDEQEQIYMVIEGCPDARNIFTYLLPVSLEPKTARFIPAAEGFEWYDDELCVLHCAGYAYHDEGGRYQTLLEYDINGKLLKKTNGEDE